MRRALLLLALAGCRPATPAPAPAPASEAADVSLFDGRVVPTSATDLNAPQNTFRVAGWASDSSWTKLTELVADGAAVKAGDVVAKFEFRGNEALPRIREHIGRAHAEAGKQAIELEASVRTLQAEREKAVIAAERSRLDTLKEGAVSSRQLALYRIERDIAAFEAEATSARLGVQRRHGEATQAWHAREVARAEAQRQRFDAYKVRFELRAPHDGVVRHAFLPHERRKVQKGDGMAAGRTVVSIARDARLSVRFFVPEHRVDEIRAGGTVRVRSVTSADEHPATVRHVDRFPQEVGFLMEDDQRPDAREKAYVVLADLADPGDLVAGNEVRVAP
jgi:multidrug efflux pump subunit AcrA (membrane-fusion protein)